MQTPLRRSKRGQPVVAGHNEQNPGSTSTGDVVHARQLRAEDLTGDQIEQLQRAEVETDSLQTCFYASFSRAGPVKRAARVYGKKAAGALIRSTFPRNASLRERCWMAEIYSFFWIIQTLPN